MRPSTTRSSSSGTPRDHASSTTRGWRCLAFAQADATAPCGPGPVDRALDEVAGTIGGIVREDNVRHFGQWEGAAATIRRAHFWPTVTARSPPAASPRHWCSLPGRVATVMDL